MSQQASVPPSLVAVRPLRASDVPAAAELHRQLGDVQFIARAGAPLLRAYYRAWMSSPSAIALGAFDADGALVGSLLGSLDAAAVYRHMVRRRGAQLAAGLLLSALVHPRFGRELLATRAGRYLRGLARMVGGSGARAGHPTGGAEGGPGVGPEGAAGPGPGSGSGERWGQGRSEATGGEVTHLIVDARRRSGGAGRSLVSAAMEHGRDAGLVFFELMADPDSPATRFYEHLGWRQCDAVRSRSGERFVRYRFDLAPPGPGPAASSEPAASTEPGH